MGKFDNVALQNRFKNWCYNCLDVINTSIITSDEYRVITKQLIRSATSAHINYRSVTRAKSKADMINKLKIVEEETDESIGWLEMIQDRHKINTIDIQIEGTELLKIIVSSLNTLKRTQ
jgi:four helix bundle protein